MARLLILAIFVAVVEVPVVLAQGGALPKGDSKQVDKKAQSAATPKGTNATTNCFVDLGQPPGGSGVFSDGGSTYYFLASQKKGKKLKSTLFKVPLKTLKAEALLSVDHQSGASLIAYGEPLAGVSVVGFTARTAGCAEGKASLVSITLDKKGGKAVKADGEFQLALAPKHRVLFDTKKRQILAMDTSNFQTKNARKIPDAERPLFYDEHEKLVTFVDDGKQRGLVRYESSDPSKAKRLAFKGKDRVLQDFDHFAAGKIDVAGNAIEIQEIDGWSGVDKPAKHRIKIPEAYPVAAAGIEVHLKKRLAVVFGGSSIARQQWQRLFIFDYVKAEPLAIGTLTGRQYFAHSAIDPSGAQILIEVKDGETRETVGLKSFSVAKMAFQDITLPE